MASEDKKTFDIEKAHEEVQKAIAEATADDIETVDDAFNKCLDDYNRFLDTKQRELRQKKVSTKEIVADEDAVSETLKTYYAINKKLQQQIADGTELSPMDIRLLTSMMEILNKA